MVNANHKWVFNLIDERRNWFIKFCQELVRIPSPNPPGDITYVAQYIKGLLDKYNISYKEHLPNANNPILISINGHIFRKHGVPTILCGPSDHGMGGVDKYISVDEYLKVVRIFAQTAVQFCGIKSIQT
jgi:acetylornithine deacetylase/succinyl-diaminopimelate desuccinylase-like protein